MINLPAKSRPAALVAALLASSLLPGCKHIPIPEPQLEGPYGAELKRDMRKEALYQGLETRLWVHAIWMNPDLVAAQAKELSELRAEPPPLAASRLAAMTAEDAAPTFFLIVYTPSANWNDFDAKSSAWRLALEGGPQGEAAPVKVTRFDGPFNAELTTIYPWLNDFSTAYRVSFPPGSMGAFPKLLLAGSLGKVELSWDPAGAP